MRHPEMRCGRCNAVLDVEWVDITAFGGGRKYVSGRYDCPTPGCGTTCPICHREPGDIHSGACAPIVLGKLTNQGRVTPEDCRAVIR